MIPADVSSGNYASDPSATQRYGKEKTTLMLLRKKGARNRNGTSVDIVWTHCGQWSGAWKCSWHSEKPNASGHHNIPSLYVLVWRYLFIVIVDL